MVTTTTTTTNAAGGQTNVGSCGTSAKIWQGDAALSSTEPLKQGIPASAAVSVRRNDKENIYICVYM